MKIFNLFIAFVCFAISAAYGQITITKANMPSAGEEYIYSTTIDQVDVSLTGPNQTWDFSQLTPVSQDTMKFKKPQDVNIAYLLPFFGDIAVQQPNGAIKEYYGFFKSGAGAYVQEGAGFTLPVLNIPLPIQYTTPDFVYRFPLTYGNRKDSSKYELNNTFQGITLAVHGKRVNMVDGYGKITTPYKSYNCIRVKSVITEHDTLGGIPVDNSRTEYKWLSTDEKAPVMQVVEWPALGTITIYRDMKVDFSANKTTVKVGDTVTFTNNTTPSDEQWAWKMSPAGCNYIMGTNSSSKAPVVVFTQPGRYDVSLVATSPSSESMSSSKPRYITVSGKTAIEQNLKAGDGIEIYPNPASGVIYITDRTVTEGSKINWRLFDITGRVISGGTIKNSMGAKIDLPDCPNGVYYMQVNNSSTQKLLIQKR